MDKRLSIFVLAMLLVVGCQATKTALSNWEACKNDPACLAEMQKAGNYTSAIVEAGLTPVTPVVGVPAIIATGVGGFASVLIGIILGARIRKKER